MLVEPDVVYADSARRRCYQICEDIVTEIRREPETPVETGALRAGYHALTDPPGAVVVSTAEYWHYQEFGTHEMPANPHVRPAIEVVRARNLR